MGVGVCIRASTVALCAATLRRTEGGRHDAWRQMMVLYVLVIYGTGFVAGPEGLVPRYRINFSPVAFVPCVISLPDEGVRR